MTQQEGCSKEAYLSFQGTQKGLIHIIKEVGFAG